MKKSPLWLLPVAAGAMMLLAAQHVYTEQRPMTRLAPPQSPARTPFTHSIGATGNPRGGFAEHRHRIGPFGNRARGVCPRRARGRTCREGRPAVPRRRSPVEGPARPGASASGVGTLAVGATGDVSLDRRKSRPASPRCRPPRPTPNGRKDEYERARSLVSQHAVSEQEAVGKRLLNEVAVQQWQQAQREHALLLAGAWKPDLAVARAAVDQAEAEVAQIQTEIERAIVRAPIEGQVLQVNVREGERVSDQSQQALMLAGAIASPARAGRHRRARHRPVSARRPRPSCNSAARTISTIR